MSDARRLVLAFNDCINARDVVGLASLMTDDHAFIDTEGNSVSGRGACLDAWRRFFSAFPDYRNTFEQLIEYDEIIVISGYSTCADPRLSGPALWTAKVRDSRVAEWRVLEENDAHRGSLGLTQ